MKFSTILLTFGAYFLPKVLSGRVPIPEYDDLTQDEIEQLKDQCQNDLLAPGNTFGEPSRTSRFVLFLEYTSGWQFWRLGRERFVKLMTKAAKEAETIQKLRNEFNGNSEEIDFYTIAIWNTQLELIHIDMNYYRGGSREETEYKLQYFFENLYDNLPTEGRLKEGRLQDSVGCTLANYVNEKDLIMLELYHDNNYFQIYGYDDQLVDTWHRNDRIFKSTDPIYERIHSMTRKNGAIRIDDEGHVHHDPLRMLLTYDRYFELKQMLKDGFTVADWENKRRSYYFFETEDDRTEY